MRNVRVFTSQPLAVAQTVELAEPASHHLARVLRLPEGSPVTLFNGDGRDFAGSLCGARGKRVSVRLDSVVVVANESPLKITLAQAVSRGERMDYCLQKAAELGVFCIQPLTTERVEVRLGDGRQARRLAHWRGVVVSACEQSGRAIVPRVMAPVSLAEWLAAASPDPRLVLSPGAELRLSSYTPPGGAVAVLVGPEGGFSEGELSDALGAGLTAVTLGPRVLRTETAGPAAIAVLQATAGDF